MLAKLTGLFLKYFNDIYSNMIFNITGLLYFDEAVAILIVYAVDQEIGSSYAPVTYSCC